jgi:MFS family permease
MKNTQGATQASAGMRRVAIASCVGSAIAFYDFYIYGEAAALVPEGLFLTLGATSGAVASSATFAVAFIDRSVGAATFGYYGDRIDRKRTLITTFLLMDLSTVLIGLLPGGRHHRGRGPHLYWSCYGSHRDSQWVANGLKQRC